MKKAEEIEEQKSTEGQFDNLLIYIVVMLFTFCLMFISFQKNMSVALDRQQNEIIQLKSYINEKNNFVEAEMCTNDFNTEITTASIYQGESLDD